MIPHEEFQKYLEDIKNGIQFPAEKPPSKECEELLKDWDGIIVTYPQETDSIYPELTAVKVKFYNGYNVYHYFYSRLDDTLWGVFESLPWTSSKPKASLSHAGGFNQIKIFKDGDQIAQSHSKKNISFAELMGKIKDGKVHPVASKSFRDQSA